METTRIVEINGIKMELDLRTAKSTRIDSFKVGDTVKVLTKKYDGYSSKPGVIVGFDEFKILPTIIIAVLDLEYSTAHIKFVYLNAESKETEMCMANDQEVPFEKGRVLELMDRELLKKEEEIRDLKSKRFYFETNFSRYFQVKAEAV